MEINEYVGTLSNDMDIKIVDFLKKYIRQSQPNVLDWYVTKVMINNTIRDGRKIFTTETSDGTLKSLMICKQTNDEDKICLLYVRGAFRELGIGRALMVEGRKWLLNKKPLITIPISMIPEFMFMFRDFKFVETGRTEVEAIYNGSVSSCSNSR